MEQVTIENGLWGNVMQIREYIEDEWATPAYVSSRKESEYQYSVDELHDLFRSCEDGGEEEFAFRVDVNSEHLPSSIESNISEWEEENDEANRWLLMGRLDSNENVEDLRLVAETV